MARIPFDANTEVYWLATAPASTSAPTVAEITAGTDITSFVTKDGLQYGLSTNKVDAGNISTLFEAQNMGTWGAGASLKVQADDTTNTAIDLFTTHATAGALVVSWSGAASFPTAGDECYVIPCEASIAMPGDSAANELQTATVELAVTSEPSFTATVAA